MDRRHTYEFGSYRTTVAERSRDELFDGIRPDDFLVSDTNTSRFLPTDFDKRLVLAAGEGSKSLKDLENLLDGILGAGLGRDGIVCGVGGGVITDIASFAASIYMRGCGLILIPTTLLAMVDAALGGKTGINFGGFKNMVGTFYPASEVRICSDVLHTLPEREYLSGLAEVIKSAMLGDDELFGMLEDDQAQIRNRNDEILADIVWRCIGVKGGVVEADLRETGIRAHLNLGHTFAHALESQIGLGSWSHGEAVAWGLARAMEAGVAAGLTPPAYARRVVTVLEAYRYNLEHLPESADSMLAAMQKDKKRQAGANRFVLQEGLGQTVIRELDDVLVGAVLRGEKPLNG